MNRNEFIDTIKEDENFYYFIRSCLKVGIRQISKDIDRGIENSATKRFKKLDLIYGLTKSILKEDV